MPETQTREARAELRTRAALRPASVGTALDALEVRRRVGAAGGAGRDRRVAGVLLHRPVGLQGRGGRQPAALGPEGAADRRRARGGAAGARRPRRRGPPGRDPLRGQGRRRHPGLARRRADHGHRAHRHRRGGPGRQDPRPRLRGHRLPRLQVGPARTAARPPDHVGRHRRPQGGGRRRRPRCPTTWPHASTTSRCRRSTRSRWCCATGARCSGGVRRRASSRPPCSSTLLENQEAKVYDVSVPGSPVTKPTS